MLRKFFAASRAADTIIRGLGQKHRFGGTFKHKKRSFFTCGQAFTRSKFAHIDEINGTRWPFSFHAAVRSLYFDARHTTETIFLTKRTKSKRIGGAERLEHRCHAGGEAGGAFDVRPAHKHDGARRGHLVEVRHDFYLQVAMVEHVALAGKIVGFRRQERGIRVEGLMPVIWISRSS